MGFGLRDSCRLCSEHQLTPFPGPSDFHLLFPLFPLLRASNSSTQQLKMVQDEKVESASRRALLS